MTLSLAAPRPGAWRERAGVWAIEAAAALVIGATVAVIAFVARGAILGYGEIGFRALLAGPHWRPERDIFGGLPLVVGTVLTSLGAIVFGVVPAVVAAAWLSELAPARVASAVRRVITIAAGVPSVVYGWLALLYLVPPLERLAHAFYGPDAAIAGEGIAAGTLLLAVMILPTVLLLAMDALERVPRVLRDAALGIGASPWQTVRYVTLPSAWRGLAIAGLLGFARAAGEAMAVQMVIGGARDVAPTPFSPTSTIAAQIVVDAHNTLPGTTADHALFALAFMLLALSGAVVGATHLLTRRRPR